MKKKGIIIAVVGAVVLAALGIFFLSSGKEEGYRMMQVYQISGKATVERENVGTMDAFENLNLITGDKVEVAADSYMRLKVDDDKYVLAEAGSIFKIYVAGSEDSGRTDIELEKGAVTVEVQNKLSDDASFEVTTPNAVMAVRGTVFRISLDIDETGEPITKIAVLEGEVSVQKKDESGNLSEEQRGKYGNEVIVYNEVEEVQIKILDEISFIDIPVEALEFLQEIVTERRELVITSEEIKKLIENLETDSQDDELLNDETEDDESQDDDSQGDDFQDNKPQNNKPQNNKPQNNEAQADGPQGGEPQNDDSQNDGSQDNDVQNDDTQDDGSQDDDVQNDDIQDNEPQDDETVETTTYTVTFTYQGKVFATQVVEAGKTAKKPTLMPAKSGNWKFDFSTPIEDDIVIEFVE